MSCRRLCHSLEYDRSGCSSYEDELLPDPVFQPLDSLGSHRLLCLCTFFGIEEKELEADSSGSRIQMEKSVQSLIEQKEDQWICTCLEVDVVPKREGVQDWLLKPDWIPIHSQRQQT